MNSFGLIAERNAVKDFSDNLRRLRDRHSRTIEEEITVRKCDVAVLHSSQFLPPRILPQYTLFPQTAVQTKPARSYDQVLGVGVAKLVGRNSSRVFAFMAKQEFAIRDLHQLGSPVSHGE